MSETPRRLRIFAGPNGSGKSSLVRSLAKEFSPNGLFRLHHWINADEIELALRSGSFEFGPLWMPREPQSFLQELASAGRLEPNHPWIVTARISESSLVCQSETVDSYAAATIADILRASLLERGDSFSFETVMSHPSKVNFLKSAHAAGYRIYLYFIATRSVAVNLTRIENRVQLGQHAVPAEKVIERYARSINLLPEALKFSYRAFLFDNSGEFPLWFAEKTPNGDFEFHVSDDKVPPWFSQVVDR